MSELNMPELQIAQTLNPQGPVSVLPATAEEKARQIPDPATYHMLCVLPDIDDEYESGLVKASQTMHYEEVLSPVLFVVKMGPDAFKDEKRFPSAFMQSRRFHPCSPQHWDANQDSWQRI